MNRRAGLAALLGLCLGLPAGAAAQNQDTARPLVTVVRARDACFSSVIPVTGYLAARREAVVILLPGDSLVEVSAGEGDRVSVDQTLAQVTRPSREPPRPGTEPRTETVALKAPAAGTIIRSSAAVGAAGSAGPTEPLFRIAVDGEIELEADVPSIHAADVTIGQSARVVIEDALELSGRVRLAPPSIDPRTQLGRARISVGPSPRLRFATFARALIDARRSCGLSVPRSAVTYRTGGTSVQVVTSNVIGTRSVQIGLHSDTDIEVTSGLAEGDRVVANAGTSLRDGDRVEPIEAGSALAGER